MFDRHARLTPIALLLAFGAFHAAPAAAKQRAVQKTPPQVLTDSAFARMSAAQQLATLGAQTGGGHLAIIGSRRYIRYPDGTLGRI